MKTEPTIKPITEPSTEPIRERWRDQPQSPLGDHPAPEKLAAAFFRALRPIARDPRAVSRVLTELVERAAKGERGMPRALFVRMALAALLVGSFGTALAVVQRWEQGREQARELVRHSAQVAALTESKPKRASVRAPVPALEPAAVAAPATEPEPEHTHRSRSHEIREAAPAPTTAAPMVAAAVSAAPSDDSLTVETSMLDRALAALGQRRPQEALATVGAYRQRFPHGKLEYEADLAEVKAQVALGKDAPALDVLDRAIAIHGFDTLPRSPDLSLLRAELLSRTGDCAGAIPVFSRLLEGEHPEPGFQERAVYGRAICLGKLGQRGESRRALRDYLNRFPDGRFVKAAQDALDPLE